MLRTVARHDASMPRHVGVRYQVVMSKSMVFESTVPQDATSDTGPHYGEPGGSQFPITTALGFPGQEIDKSLGMVFGVVVRSMGLGKNITAGIRSLAGGEVKQYTRLVEDSRRHALDRMIANGQLVGADAIVSFRFDSSEVGKALTEIVAYGTAVTFKKP
jgi:uncharacterized protein YbjQ (UPF0145 family)